MTDEAGKQEDIPDVGSLACSGTAFIAPGSDSRSPHVPRSDQRYPHHRDRGRHLGCRHGRPDRPRPHRVQAEPGRHRFDDLPDLCHCRHRAGLSGQHVHCLIDPFEVRCFSVRAPWKVLTREPVMKETPIFRNIQHVPRVWGVTYPKLFATLGGGLLATTLGFVMTPGATAVVKVLVIGLGVAATLLGYGVCFLMDNTDRLESDSASFLKAELSSQSLSLQKLTIFDREAV